MNYTQTTIKGFGWHSLVKIITAGLALGKIFFLARLLTPSDFGLFSLTTIALGLTEAATQTGINTTIIQSKNSVSYFLDTAWVIAIIRGLVIAILMMIVGLIMQKTFSQPDILFLVSLASTVPIIKGFINPYIVSLHKDLNFLGDSIYRIFLVTSDSLWAVILAWLTHSVYALVFAIIITSVFEVIFSFLFFSQKPRFNLIKSRAKTILSNAKWLNSLAFFSYANENLDNYLIGQITGIRNLGLYHNSYALSHRPYDIFGKAATHSTFPVLVKLVHKPARFKRAIIKTLTSSMSLIALISLPIFLFPELAVKIILGNQWLEIIPFIRILVLAALILSFTSVAYTIFISLKEYIFVQVHLILSMVTMVVLILLLGHYFGLIGTIWAIIFSRLISLPVAIFGLINLFKKKHV